MNSKLFIVSAITINFELGIIRGAEACIVVDFNRCSILQCHFNTRRPNLAGGFVAISFGKTRKRCHRAFK